MRGGIVAQRTEEAPRSQRPGSAPDPTPRWMGFRAVERAIVLARVSDVLAAGASALEPADLLTAVCEAMASHFALTNAVLFKRVAGQARTLVWSAPGVTVAGRMAAREQAWTSAAELVEDGTSLSGQRADATCASMSNERLGLSALLYIESARALDSHDRRLVADLLRRMLCLPAHEG